MNEKDMQSFGVQSLSSKQSCDISGGILPIIVGVMVLAISLGYSDGRRDKE